MTTQPVPAPPIDDAPQEPLGNRLTWLLKGFAWPCFSRPYYVEATRRRLMVGILFLALFAVLQTLVVGTQTAVLLGQIKGDIARGYAESGFPVIVIADGMASAEPIEPFVWAQQGNAIVIDTTGQMTELDRTQYRQGFMLTRTDLHVLNQGQYQVLPLETLHETFGNPIVINEETAAAAAETIVALLIPLSFIAIYFFSLIIRLLYFIVIGLVIWGITSVKHKGYEYSKVLMVGIFASVPTWYLTFLLELMGISFCLFYTIVLVAIWGIAMAFVLRGEATPDQGSSPTPLPASRSLATRPMPKVFELPHEVRPPAPPDDDATATRDGEQ